MRDTKKLIAILFFFFFSTASSSAETWSVASKVKLIFPQAERENSSHPHSEKILAALEDMSWLPGECSNSPYFYFEKTDTHLLSVLMSAQATGSTVQVSVTNLDRANGVCRATMLGSPTWK